MSELWHLQKFGATAGCTLRLIESCQFAGFEKQVERASAKLEKKAEVFIANSWFGSIRAAKAIKHCTRILMEIRLAMNSLGQSRQTIEIFQSINLKTP
jgi:tRNA(Leu) C34 or U34 (ribose-2'-O)-methylase TrmL